MEQDYLLYDISKDQHAKVQSSNLNEELGVVQYIFSDKTGTLTQNVMEFKKFSAGSFSYGKSHPAPQTYEPGLTNVNFEDETFWQHWTDENHSQHKHLYRFIECLAICHTVIAEKKIVKGQECLIYNASSPDELALVNGMRYFGFEFRDRDEDNNVVIDVKRTKEVLHYKVLHILEFNSDRKRMSVIVKTSDDRIMLVCKGADSIINQRLATGQEYLELTNRNLAEYAEVGLRTLLIAYRYIDPSYYQEWFDRYTQAATSTHNREKMIDALAEEIEVELELAGCSAIEDKLQDQVGLTIKDIRATGIKVWVLTGDKVETAINIGQSCQLLTKE